MPHALYTAEGAEVCLIVKDHKGEGHKEAKKRVKQAEIARIAKVPGLAYPSAFRTASPAAFGHCEHASVAVSVLDRALARCAHGRRNTLALVCMSLWDHSRVMRYVPARSWPCSAAVLVL